MGKEQTGTVYAIPRGFVTADPGRNRYIRRQGTSMDLPPRLNPQYSQDIADPKNAIDKVGVATDLALIAGPAAAALAPSMTIPAAIGGAALAGLHTFDELRKSQRMK